MYTRDIPKLPNEMSREKFVDLVFDLGSTYNHQYESIVESVMIADRMISYHGMRYLFNNLPKINKIDIMCEPIQQHYSIELAHVVTVIISKVNEDTRYDTIASINNTDNIYVLKMEWEICLMLEFKFRCHNFMTDIGCLLYENFHTQLSSIFWDLAKDICMNKNLLQMSTTTLLTGIVILYQHNLLKAIRTNKERYFFTTMFSIASEYELDLISVLKAYIKYKS